MDTQTLDGHAVYLNQRAHSKQETKGTKARVALPPRLCFVFLSSVGSVSSRPDTSLRIHSHSLSLHNPHLSLFFILRYQNVLITNSIIVSMTADQSQSSDAFENSFSFRDSQSRTISAAGPHRRRSRRPRAPPWWWGFVMLWGGALRWNSIWGME